MGEKSSEYIVLDSYSKIIESRFVKESLTVFFREGLITNFLLDSALIVYSIILIVIWPRFYYSWTFILRIGFVVEWILTLILCFENIRVVHLFGPGDGLLKVIRYLTYNRILGVRMWICYIYFIMNIIILIIHLILFGVQMEMLTLQFLFYIILDVIFLFEPFFAIWTIYFIGVKKNIQFFIL